MNLLPEISGKNMGNVVLIVAGAILHVLPVHVLQCRIFSIKTTKRLENVEEYGHPARFQIMM